MIGLVGGLGIGAGVHYYRELAAAHETLVRPLDLVLVHGQVSRIFQHAAAGDHAGMAEYLAGILASMRAAGATLGVIPAVTPHLCIDQLERLAPLPIVNLLEAVAAEVERRQLRRVAVFGTRFVVESDFLGRLHQVEVVRPSPDEVTLIHDTYVRVAAAGRSTAGDHAALTAVAKRLCDDAGVDAVLLAGTDLSLVFDQSNTGFPNVDCAGVHIQAIMRRLSA
ncbi:MAG: aspartate/glutamate racemase family protein [Vicinamibacterales bacterium]